MAETYPCCAHCPADAAAGQHDDGDHYAPCDHGCDDAQFQIGQEVTWTGCAGLFERRVTIAGARRSGLAVFGEVPGTGPWIYDIHDAEVIKGIIYAVPAEQLHE